MHHNLLGFTWSFSWSLCLSRLLRRSGSSLKLSPMLSSKNLSIIGWRHRLGSWYRKVSFPDQTLQYENETFQTSLTASDYVIRVAPRSIPAQQLLLSLSAMRDITLTVNSKDRGKEQYLLLVFTRFYFLIWIVFSRLLWTRVKIRCHLSPLTRVGDN